MDASPRDRLAAAATATLVHGAMAAGLYLGRLDADASVLGVLLDSLFAYVTWLVIYLRLRPSGAGVKELLGKTFVGLSFGIWGFIGMFRAITTKDTVLLAFNAAILEGLGNMGNVDGEAGAVILLILAIVLLVASLYFLGKIMVVMSLADLAWITGGVALFRVVDIVRYVHRHRDNSFTEKVADAEDHLAELCLHVFVKGWAGALIMLFLMEVPFSLVWIYLGWSYAYDLLLRAWLWRKVGPWMKGKVLARAASRVVEREPRPSFSERRAARRAARAKP